LDGVVGYNSSLRTHEGVAMKDKKIFILDDDMTALDLIDFLLGEKGFNVARSANGATAIGLINDMQPDIILVDLMMPGMSGQECVREIRKLGINVPIVAFTAVDDEDLHGEALEAGCNTILVKPCKPSILIDKIIKILEEAQQA
jgi:DNA-binding response OmpR family regulator